MITPSLRALTIRPTLSSTTASISALSLAPRHLSTATPAPPLHLHLLQRRTRARGTANFASFTPPSTSLCVVHRFSTSSSRKQLGTMAGAAPTELRFKNPAILVCDLQEKFRTAIYEFDNVVRTTQKLLTFANNLSIPVHATTQTAAKLGPTVPAIDSLIHSPTHDKTRFSMLVPSIASALAPASRIALVGIESHICITQTALDLRDAGHVPYVIADAVSSCNKTEVVIALDRLRAEPGIVVTSSESWMYECMGDAAHAGFKGMIGVVKGAGADTKTVLEKLPPLSKI